MTTGGIDRKLIVVLPNESAAADTIIHAIGTTADCHLMELERYTGMGDRVAMWAILDNSMAADDVFARISRVLERHGDSEGVLMQIHGEESPSSLGLPLVASGQEDDALIPSDGDFTYRQAAALRHRCYATYHTAAKAIDLDGLRVAYNGAQTIVYNLHHRHLDAEGELTDADCKALQNAHHMLVAAKAAFDAAKAALPPDPDADMEIPL